MGKPDAVFLGTRGVVALHFKVKVLQAVVPFQTARTQEAGFTYLVLNDPGKGRYGASAGQVLGAQLVAQFSGLLAN